MKYIDTHAHYQHKSFNKDREELLREMFEGDLANIVECGTNAKSNAIVLEMCEKHPQMFATIGFFPTNTGELEDETVMKTFLSQLQLPKVVGLGEIGLDYYHKSDVAQQKKWFMEQLKIAKKMKLPVCIHSRDAEADTLAILKNNGATTGVIHCYSYGVKTMRELVKLGYYFGVGGTSTYQSNTATREAIKEMPMERIVLETDSPFLTPSAVRRERNDSRKIKYVIAEIAKLKGMKQEDVIKITNENVKHLYPKMFQS